MGGVQVIERLLGRLDVYVRSLREFDAVTEERFRDDGFVRDALERRLQRAVEVCADIADTIIRELDLRAPADRADLFRVLGEAGLLDYDLVERMLELVRYRNRIVHDYEFLDPVRVLGFRRNHMGDFQDFAAFVDAYLTNQAENDPTPPPEPSTRAV